MTGHLIFDSKFDGMEIKPGVTLIGEPTAHPETDKLRCLANAFGALCVVELSIKFKSTPVVDGVSNTNAVEGE